MVNLRPAVGEGPPQPFSASVVTLVPPTTAQLEERLKGHEDICLLRYEILCKRLSRIERILIGTVAFIIPALLAILAKVVIGI
jgi:hypothetical protein